MNNYYKIYFNNRLVAFLLTSLFLTAYNLQLNATIRYVSKTGLSIPPYTSWETAADSIQKCINICVFGDTIYVANGVYEEQVVMIPGLTLVGAGTDSCIVDSRNFPLSNNRTITMQDSSLVTGFYIRSSNNFTYGYGIWAVGQTGLITQNKFSEANRGIALRASNIEVYKNHFFNIRGGIDVFNSNSIVRKNDIVILTDVFGSGIFIEAFNSNYKPLVDSNYIESRGDGIDKSIGSRPTITNNKIMLLRLGSEGIRVSDSDSAYVFNNIIIVKSGFQASDGIRNYGVQNLQIYNNQILGNYLNYVILMGPWDKAINNLVTDADGWVTAYSGGNFQYKYNDVWNSNIGYGFIPDTTNLSVDPMVVNDDSTQGELDFHLQKYSPLIDAGDPNILDKDSTRSDIGLYGGPYGESYIYVDFPPRPPVNLTANVDSLIKLNWNKNTEADFSYYNVYRDTAFNFTIDSTKLIASVTDTFYYHTFPSNIETLYYKLTAVDNQGNESNPSEQVAVILVSVKNEWKPVNNYILYQNYPNPFNPSTRIGYKLKERGYVKLYVYDIKGELVSVLLNQTQEAGYYEVEFNAGGRSQESGVRSQLASGVYIYQIMVSNDNRIPVFSDIKKMIYVK
jgi:hypothetical protein